MAIDTEKLKYLLNTMDMDIGELIYNILSDSPTDRHYSAVAASNKIKCYIEIMTELGQKPPYNNVKEFFEFNAYTEEEYEAFEKVREEESKIYRGIQY